MRRMAFRIERPAGSPHNAVAMNARQFGVTDDPYEQAAADVAPHRNLTVEECGERFLDLIRFTELAMQNYGDAEWFRIVRIHGSLDDPGHWWERVPAR